MLPHPLRVITYLVPSLPEDLFRMLADYLAKRVGQSAELLVDTTLSGPPRGGPEPFSRGEADLAFLCTPPYLWLTDQVPSPVELIPAGLMFDDARNRGRPVYFSDVIVRASAPWSSFADLRGQRLAYNDTCSLSGYYSLLRRLDDLGGGTPAGLTCSGSHLESIRWVLSGRVAAAAIDSNVLARQLRNEPGLIPRLRVLESWGPFPIQPIVARAELGERVIQAMTDALLGASSDPVLASRLAELGVRGFAPVADALYDDERALLADCTV